MCIYVQQECIPVRIRTARTLTMGVGKVYLPGGGGYLPRSMGVYLPKGGVLAQGGVNLPGDGELCPGTPIDMTDCVDSNAH